MSMIHILESVRVWAQVSPDGGTIGGVPTGSVLNFGGAGLLFAAICFFLTYLKSKDEREGTKDEKTLATIADNQKRYQDQVERLFDRLDQVVQSSRQQMAGVIEGQNALLRDVTKATVALETTVRSVQDAVSGSANTTKAIEAAIKATDTSVGSLRAGMTALEVMVRTVVVHLPAPVRTALGSSEVDPSDPRQIR